MLSLFIFLFFFNDTATTEIYTLSLHDALPISTVAMSYAYRCALAPPWSPRRRGPPRRPTPRPRSEEHTSELQSRLHLVCRLLLEKKKKTLTSTSQLHHDTVKLSRVQDVRELTY